MKEVTLCDLPRWSTWPTRLLGLTTWKAPTRTVEKVDQEYDKEKYAGLLAYYHERGGKLTADDIEQRNYGRPEDQSTCVSIGNNLFEVPLAQAREQYYSLLRDHLRPLGQTCQTVVELGAGYGYNLWMLRKSLSFAGYWGGEYSGNAVELASRLYRPEDRIQVVRFNYYDAATYDFLRKAPAPIVVFTSHSLEQIPTAGAVFDALEPHRDIIAKVIHFEPAYELYDDSLMGQMRARYTQLNNYNTDLIDQLRGRAALRIENIDTNVFGLNVLNPTSVIRWSFA
jgi:hypothetical protein